MEEAEDGSEIERRGGAGGRGEWRKERKGNE